MSKAAVLLIVALTACSRTATAQSAVEHPNIELRAAAEAVGSDPETFGKSVANMRGCF